MGHRGRERVWVKRWSRRERVEVCGKMINEKKIRDMELKDKALRRRMREWKS